MIPFLLIGNPENRRVVEFARDLQAVGCTPTILAHADLLEDLSPLAELPDAPRWVRIDTVGESWTVEKKLLAWGRGPHDLDPHRLGSERRGELIAPRQSHQGFVRYLEALERIFADKPSWRILNPPRAIIRLFDKLSCWRLHRDAGVPVPEAIDEPIKTPDELRAAMDKRTWKTAFVKLSHGSSASGLGVLMRAPQERFMTTLRRHDGGWFNSLRVVRLARRAEIDRALGFILEQGAHIERAIPKARLDNAWFDLRVLVIDGEPSFTVVRQSRHPITNLHLGGWRGSLQELRSRAPGDALTSLYETCRRTAALHASFHLGLDLLFTADFSGHRLIEANAFGDLIPNLTVDARTVYQTQIDRILTLTGAAG